MQVYDHHQSVGSDTWAVSHNFNTDAVVVDVFIDFEGSLEKIIPLSIEATDNNTVTITFSSSQTGWAHVVG